MARVCENRTALGLKAEDRAAREELVALVFSAPASSLVARRSSINSPLKKELLLLSFSFYISHLRESWRAGIEATREDVREEHCILIECRERRLGEDFLKEEGFLIEGLEKKIE